MTSFYTAENLRCTGCGETYSLPVRDLFLYSDGDLDLSPANLNTSSSFHPVLKVRAWCIDCNRPTLAERIPSTQEFMNAVALTRNPGLQHDIQDELLEIRADELRFLFEKLTRRKSKGKCLLCGSTDWFRLDVIDGQLQPSLIHDGFCNSPFEWQPWIGGIIGKIAVRAYSFEGVLLAQGEAVA